MANCVFSIRRFSSIAGMVKRCENSPEVRSGKSEAGSACRKKRERPERSEELPGVAGDLEARLRPFGQLAHDVVDDMSRHGRRASLYDVGRRLLGRLEVEVGAFERQLPVGRFDQHVGEDRDRIATLDNAVNVPEGLEQDRTLDGDFHRKTSTTSFPRATRGKGARTLPRRVDKRKTALADRGRFRPQEARLLVLNRFAHDSRNLYQPLNRPL